MMKMMNTESITISTSSYKNLRYKKWWYLFTTVEILPDFFLILKVESKILFDDT
jgi:hypothetical protein